MLTLTQSLASAMEPWAELYGSSGSVEVAVAFLHFAGLLAAGGFALAFDRAALLRVGGRDEAARRAFLDELSAVHRPVLAGLAVVVLSGVAMLLADVEALLPSPAFWLKMGIFALLLANGALMRRTEQRLHAEPGDGAGWRRLRGGAAASMGLWFAVLLMGVVLTLSA